jgi:TonB family protein
MKLKCTLAGIAAALAATVGFGSAADADSQDMPRDRRPADQRAANLSQFEARITALEREASLKPGDAPAQHLVGTAYYEKTRDASVTADQKREYLARGLKAEDRALDANPNYVEALVYKNIMLRTQALAETDPAAREALIREADTLRNRAMQLQSARGAETVPVGAVLTPGPPPPPPPPPPGGTPGGQVDWVYATTDYTTASGARPKQTRNVRPIYAPMVIASGVKGDVVLEAMIDPGGKVSQLRVVKSQPMLTQAAYDAVRQWEFDPATVGGGAVITVTATFTAR